MCAKLWSAGLASLLVLGLVWLAWRRLSRRSAAGIHTSAAGRSARLGGLLARSLLRRWQLRLLALLAGRRRRRALLGRHQLRSAEEAARLMGEMKGVLMKLGQIVSYASPSLPAPVQQALRGLQQDAPPMDYSLVRRVIERDLGCALSSVVRQIDEAPIAAASIGQVHRARLHDGSQVVFKVQYPGVDEAIESDLRLSGALLPLARSLFPNAEPEAVVQELRQRLRDELDYRQELRHQQVFAEIWQGHPLIRVPRVYPEHSSRRVLCQQHCRGLGYYEFLRRATQKERDLAVFVLNDFVWDSMHRHHLFNGDPHPGNYLFAADGGVTFVDFGCVKHFDAAFIGRIQALNRAIVQEDRSRFDALVHEMRIVLPGREYDGDFVWDFFAYHAAPFARDRVFSFDRAFIARAAEVMAPGNLRRLNLPPELLLFNRITFGLNAIFAELGASANFHRLYRRYLYPEEARPPALAVAGAELAPRFLGVDPLPVQRSDLVPDTVSAGRDA